MWGDGTVTRKSPTYDLATIQVTFSTVDTLRMTGSARRGAVALGFSDQDVVDAIKALSPDDFYKSMPPVNPAFTAMQDVYKSVFHGIELYIKFQLLSDGQIVLSFKQK